jgi:hypothetical protein
MNDQIEAVRLAMVACREALSSWHDDWNPPLDREARVFVAAMQAYEKAKTDD